MKKISSLFVVLLLMLASFTAGVEYQRGDVDQNGQVNIADVSCLIDYLLSGVWSDDPVNPEEPQTVAFTVNGVSFTMVTVEGGSFMMGASDDDADATDREKPAHEVTLSSYSIGETEVTQALWHAVMGSNPSDFTGDLQRPVEQVSWNDCQSFIARLNQLTGKNFRLPTEAEWEYAARGGKNSQGYIYAGSNSIGEVAWYTSNSNLTTHPVATKAPNELGLYDMTGNVTEWCQDLYNYMYYSNSPTDNPTGPLSGSSHLLRGGSWAVSAEVCRVSARYVGFPASANNVLGLRLALDLDNSPKFRLSETVVTVHVGESKTVEILNGDGNYTVNGGSDYVTSTVSGNSLTVTGTNEETTTVHVTNTSTGAIAVLTVIVNGGQEYVDLGLPSGTLWATCNVGANAPEEYGDYFAWGETEPKQVYDWSTYKWSDGEELTKYCNKSNYGYNGYTDDRAELDPEDDAAYVNWGPEWRMPTVQQLDELYEQCTWTWTQLNGVNGRLVTGPNGNTLFLPAGGGYNGDTLKNAGIAGSFWSRTLAYTIPSYSFFLGFVEDGVYSWSNGDRFCGVTVRAVRAPQE